MIVMKNRVYESTAKDLAQYLTDRENRIKPIITMKDPDTTVYRKRIGEDSMGYRSTLEYSKCGGIPYKINTFVNENKVQILLDKYIVSLVLKYIDYDKTSLTFRFEMPKQQIFDFTFDFEKYAGKFSEASMIIDSEIKSRIDMFISHIFHGARDDVNGEFVLNFHDDDDIINLYQVQYENVY